MAQEFDPAFKPTYDPAFKPTSVEEQPGILQRAWKATTEPLSDLPSRMASTVAEPMMSFGESGPGMGRKASLYGGAFLQSVGDVMSAMTSPADLGMAIGTGGGSMIARQVPKLGRALYGAGQLSSLGVMGHGAQNVYQGEGIVEKGLGALEMVGGAMGVRAPRAGSRLANIADTKPTPKKGPLLEQKATTSQIEEVQKVVPKVETPDDALKAAMRDSKPLNEEQALKYTQERRSRLAQMADVEETGRLGFHMEKRALAGEMDKVEITPLSEKVSPQQLDELMVEIKDSPNLLEYETINAREGLEKFYNGRVPQNSELAVMRKVFGDEFGDLAIEIVGKGGKNKPLGFWGRVGAVQDFARSALTSYDMSAPLRQGKNFITTSEFWRALPTMVKSWGNKGFFDANQAEILSRKNFMRSTRNGKVMGQSVAERGGLDMTNLTSNKEELFRSAAAQRVPYFGAGVRASERAYLGFLNKLRADSFDRMVGAATERMGKDLDTKTLKQIGAFVNDATGRGNLGVLEDHAKLMNNVFFAPRLHAGKIRMYGRLFNPATYTQAPAEVRKETLRALLGSAGLGVMLGELSSMAGAEVSNDPTSADFRKIQIGNTRVDPFGGDQQYGVLAAKLLTGKSTSTITDRETDIWENQFGRQNAGSLLWNFVQNRLAPVPSFAVALLTQSDFGGGEFSTLPGLDEQGQIELGAVLSRTVPIMVQDIVELAQEDPTLLPLAAPAFFGMGVQTYGRTF